MANQWLAANYWETGEIKPAKNQRPLGKDSMRHTDGRFRIGQPDGHFAATAIGPCEIRYRLEILFCFHERSVGVFGNPERPALDGFNAIEQGRLEGRGQRLVVWQH